MSRRFSYLTRKDFARFRRVGPSPRSLIDKIMVLRENQALKARFKKYFSDFHQKRHILSYYSMLWRVNKKPLAKKNCTDSIKVCLLAKYCMVSAEVLCLFVKRSGILGRGPISKIFFVKLGLQSPSFINIFCENQAPEPQFYKYFL